MNAKDLILNLVREEKNEKKVVEILMKLLMLREGGYLTLDRIDTEREREREL